MRIRIGGFFLAILILFGCKPPNVQVTITYDKNLSTGFPYAYYGETAKIYYTISGQHYEKEVQKHHSIQITVPERTEIRVTYEKFISDVNGQRTTLEDAFYKAKSDNPNFVIR